MADLEARLGRYLHDTLGVAVIVTPWGGADRVFPFLQDRYRFLTGRILGQRCLFMADRGEREEAPAVIRKHVDQLYGKWDDFVVYVRERITAYNRKRLIEQKVPFVVPGNQMYLPMLGIDLREHLRKLRREKNLLTPAAQAVLIHALLRGHENLGPTVLAGELGYSVMTMSRALDELEAPGLGQSVALGRARCLCLTRSRRAVWEEAQPLLRSPVRSRHALPTEPGGEAGYPRAGLSALADLTMLAEPANPTFAVGRKDWAAIRSEAAPEATPPDEPGTASVEVWHYAPTLFAHDGRVDRLSLYLSLREVRDERVQAALEKVIQEVPW
ncbi:MAG: hypothetical protein MUE73_20800 [Planctomycetes bacterium]|nr:hypothetical protein [Planctomycetota bacterium]